MARSLGTAGAVLAVWAVMGVMSIAGALCYAELGSRFPEAGGAYVYLREAFGERCAFVYGWMALLVMDPGLTAALGVGLAQYLLVILQLPLAFVKPVAIGAILLLAGVSAIGMDSSARLLRWTAVAKLATIALLIGAVVLRGDASAAPAPSAAPLSFPLLAGAFMGAFFAFGGWWDLGKMSEEVVEPRRTMPIALIGGIGVATLVYAALTVAFLRVLRGSTAANDEAAVAALGSLLFGAAAGKLIAAAVVVAVAGSLAAVLLGAPRVYLAMARSRVFPAFLVQFHPTRQSAARATLIQVVLACLLASLGTFNQILGYFVPTVVLFVGLAAASMFFLPRPREDTAVFRAPWHPVPLVVFLLLVAVIVFLFAAGQPRQTLVGAAVVALGIPVSFLVLRRDARAPAHAVTPPSPVDA
jgi:APA family basic amino acid/polyamine antiporter